MLQAIGRASTRLASSLRRATAPTAFVRDRAAAVGARGFSASADTKDLKLFDKILIANRGEIACRIIRTCKKLGVRTVAVYSDADKNSQHVKLADEAYHIGEAAAAKSYLVADRILDVCKQSGAQAVHPGYGFLSENAAFARSCGEANIKFIGPPIPAIDAMGSKSESKKIMIGADVPVIPGYHGEDQSIERLQKEADAMGYPVLIKAVLGGGGKGMRICWKSEDLAAAVESSRHEAMASFNDDNVLVEKYLVNPRHVELQVFADEHGNCVHLFERDCSLQRRYQKVIEEAPAPHMPEELRASMGNAAVAAAKAVGYAGAGTVEFILDADSNYYFMEMNTRLQVEHPVTEMITGKDLVELQLQAASGWPLTFAQEDLSINGHSFEARIYSERPDNNFLPANGRLDHLVTAEPSDSVRIESGVVEGDEVSVHYDPMIAKLVVHDRDRNQALNKLIRCLQDYEVVGLPTNIDFLLTCAQHPTFRAGTVDTGFIDEFLEDLLPDTAAPTPADALALAGVSYALKSEGDATQPNPADVGSPWNDASLASFRIGTPSQQTVTIIDGGVPTEVVVRRPDRSDAGHFEVSVQREGDDSATAVEIFDAALNGTALSATLNGQKISATSVVLADSNPKAPGNDSLDFFAPNHFDRPRYSLEVQSTDLGNAAGGAAKGSVTAPMPGKIIRVMVEPGQEVEAGTPLVVMEAMKMEHVLEAPFAGKVSELFTGVDDFVADSDVVVMLE